ncbi:MAG TPA: hypothetical protein DCX06_13240 [Opitutae bacterium]|jgi:hypothetical protein|nr:hypothetical protein [Opitutae bacterium]
MGKALASANEREAAFHLNKIQDQALKQTQIHASLRQLLDSTPATGLSLNALRLHSMLIIASGRLAQSFEDLNLLISMTEN